MSKVKLKNSNLSFILIFLLTIIFTIQSNEFEDISVKHNLTNNQEITLDIQIPNNWHIYSHDATLPYKPTNLVIKDLSNYKIIWPQNDEPNIYSSNKKILIKLDKPIDKDLQITIDYVLCGDFCYPGHKLINIRYEYAGSIYYYLLISFLGGFIINLMPCILPLISLKLSSFSKNIGKESILFNLMGIISSFLVLAYIIILAKILGYKLGFGFQLQNKYFLAALIFIVNSILINNLRSNKSYALVNHIDSFLNKVKSNKLQEFLNGFFITLIGSSCSAPILNIAVNYSFMLKNNWQIILTFFSMGIGMGLPYILALTIPKINKMLKKLSKYSKIIHIVSYISLSIILIWFLYLYLVITNYINILIMAFSLFTIWLTRKKKIWFILFILNITAIFFLQSTIQQNQDKIEYKSYLNGYKGVLIKVSASWCLTCKYNDLIILNKSEFKDILQKNSIKLVELNYTNFSYEIYNFMVNYNNYAIPFNILFLKKDNDLIETVKLSPLMSIEELQEALK